jgi:hypothetical protein
MRSYRLPEIRTYFLALAHKKPRTEESPHSFFCRHLETNNIVTVYQLACLLARLLCSIITTRFNFETKYPLSAHKVFIGLRLS